MGNTGDACHVDDSKVRIGGCLEKQDLGVLVEQRLDLFGPGHVDGMHGDAEAGQAPREEGEGAAVDRMVDDDLVTGAYQGPYQARDSPDAGRDRETGFSALQARHPLLEQRLGRVARAAIDVAWPLSPKHLA